MWLKRGFPWWTCKKAVCGISHRISLTNILFFAHSFDLKRILGALHSHGAMWFASSLSYWCPIAYSSRFIPVPRSMLQNKCPANMPIFWWRFRWPSLCPFLFSCNGGGWVGGVMNNRLFLTYLIWSVAGWKSATLSFLFCCVLIAKRKLNYSPNSVLIKREWIYKACVPCPLRVCVHFFPSSFHSPLIRSIICPPCCCSYSLRCSFLLVPKYFASQLEIQALQISN